MASHEKLQNAILKTLSCFLDRTCCTTVAPHSELHGVTGWVMPTPLTALNTVTFVLA